ncbi:hypothetical protein TTHT_0914 [Thermotomaculum hydrothermale]|uniref:Pilus assembly protein PilO n=1 Tax=Thermotomaculum hydrothermale TaxID=981385 RepID=A0A7R6SYB8_9BACT|nr:type 4a pilus biogenesis protein PilO [Thermotomaculum hydrothermale]BBB32470.1 hypothetical protein TTHT_0914 [Thermotomaculum hydrothermale]
MRVIVDYFFENRKFYLILLSILALNILFFYFFTFNEYNLFHNTKSEIEAVEKELKTVKKQFSQLNKVTKNVKKVKRTIFTIKKNNMKVLEKDFPELTGKIYQILNTYNINFQHISYNKKELRDLGIIKVTIHIPLKTTYYNFRRCLNDLEAIPFPVIIERISVNSVEANSISATVDLGVYYRGKQK